MGQRSSYCTQTSHRANIVCCKLLADDSTHLADGLHTADQILLHGHSQIPPKIKVVLGIGLRTVERPFIMQMVFASDHSPMTARIWPMVCIPRIRFFFIDISLPPKSNVVCWSGTHPAQKLSVSLHAAAHFFLGHFIFHFKSLFLNLSLFMPAGGCLCL